MSSLSEAFHQCVGRRARAFAEIVKAYYSVNLPTQLHSHDTYPSTDSSPGKLSVIAQVDGWCCVQYRLLYFIASSPVYHISFVMSSHPTA